MKRNIYVCFVLLFATAFGLKAQIGGDSRVLPEVQLKNIEMTTVSSLSIDNEGKPIIISFWATWCKPCIQELVAIQDLYPDWQEETGVKLIAISIDDARNAAKVAPFVNGRGWDYEVYLDVNQDFKRALNVVNVPHTFVLDGSKTVVWDHNSYAPGDEEHLYEVVKKVAAGKPLDEEKKIEEPAVKEAPKPQEAQELKEAPKGDH